MNYEQFDQLLDKLNKYNPMYWYFRGVFELAVIAYASRFNYPGGAKALRAEVARRWAASQ